MTESAETIMLWGLSLSTWIQIAIAFIGFPAVVYELLQVAKGLRSTARASVYDFSARVKEALIANPELVPFFERNREISTGDPRYPKVMAIADLYAVYLEVIATQGESISAANRGAWSRYVRRVYAESPAIRNHIDKRKDEFSDEFWKLLQKNKGEDLRTTDPCPGMNPRTT